MTGQEGDSSFEQVQRQHSCFRVSSVSGHAVDAAIARAQSRQLHRRIQPLLCRGIPEVLITEHVQQAGSTLAFSASTGKDRSMCGPVSPSLLLPPIHSSWFRRCNLGKSRLQPLRRGLHFHDSRWFPVSNALESSVPRKLLWQNPRDMYRCARKVTQTQAHWIITSSPLYPSDLGSAACFKACCSRGLRTSNSVWRASVPAKQGMT